MSTYDEEFLQRLRATFRVEAGEHVLAMSTTLLALEKSPQGEGRVGQIESVFRAAHSLKGAARAVNAASVEAICQSLEAVFAAWKRDAIEIAAEGFDVLHRAIDLMGRLAPSEYAQASEEDLLRVSAVAEELGVLTAGESSERTQAPTLQGPRPEVQSSRPSEPTPVSMPFEGIPTTRERAALTDTIRVSTAKLDRLLLRAEEMLIIKQAGAKRSSDLLECKTLCEDSVRDLARVQGELRRARSQEAGWTQASDAAISELVDRNIRLVRSLEEKLSGLRKAMHEDQHFADGLLDDLVEDSKKLLMLPFSALSDPFPILVRDLSRDQGKEVDLKVQGGEIEMDRRVLEEMKDALVHLLRNSVDHGIERPEVREQLGKPRRASIAIRVTPRDGNKIEILLSDDGSGINVGRLKEAAINRGATTAEELSRLGDQYALSLIFRSEVSTSPILTEISGRGLGLAIVRERVGKLGGNIRVESDPATGTTFRIVLPLTLATFRGILVRAGGQHFVLPMVGVERVARVKTSSVRTVENRETIDYDGRAMSLGRLERVLEVSTPTKTKGKPEFIPIVLLGSGDDRIAFAVDEVVHEEEVLVKNFSSPLSRVRNISGATILGSGKVVPILNVGDLMKSVRRPGFAAPNYDANVEESGEISVRKRILVAEDSITSRMLLKNIIESAGHEVKTAVDGVAALTELRTGDFDLVVSDVEMPRMNGFDLIVQIRSDRKLADIPVILVTALASREDRERGVDVGASAYIVKSSFDQSNLLEAIRRLS